MAMREAPTGHQQSAARRIDSARNASPGQARAPLSSGGTREWGGFGEHRSVDDVAEPAFQDAEGSLPESPLFLRRSSSSEPVVEPCLGQRSAV